MKKIKDDELNVPTNMVQLGNSTTFKLKISDCIAHLDPKELDSGLIVLLEASALRALTFEFNMAQEVLVCKIFTEDQKGYPETYSFTPSQFAKLLRTSNRKSKNPLDEEKDIFEAGSKAKEIKEAKKLEVEETKNAPKKRTRRRKLT